MFDELKQLMDVFKDAPNVVIWLVVGFFVYKLVMYLSVTGVAYKIASLLITKAHNAYISERPTQRKVTSIHGFDEITLTDCLPELMKQLRRIRGKGLTITSRYIHEQSVDWLKEAIDDKEAKDEKNNG